MTTPPGWYPDPDPNAGGPRGRERWWDGTAWSGQTRSRAAARGPFVAGLVGVLVLAGALVVSAVLAFGGASAGDERAGAAASPSAPPPPAGRAPGPGDGEPTLPADPDLPGPDADPGAGTPAVGVDLPVLDGWQRDPGVPMVGTGDYACPRAGGTGGHADRDGQGGDGDDGGGTSCLRGAAAIVVAGSGAGDSVRKAAEADIRRYAELAYDKATYGGITSHEVVEAGRTTIAGQPAYRVRWKIVNRIKPDAYVESVAFPHPDGSGEMLLLRSGFDIHDGAPPLRDMDRIAAGVTRSRPDGGRPGQAV